MVRVMMTIVLVLAGAAGVCADTFSWTDANGVINFTDDPGSIPPRYRARAKKGDDISVNNPKVQQEIKDINDRARQESSTRTRIVPTPDYVPPAPPAAAAPVPVTDELPPGRTKSQRIRDNIQRREAEEREQGLKK